MISVKDFPQTQQLYQSLAFAKVFELQREIEIFKKKYKTKFAIFEKKVKTSKKEKAEAWDDYIVWSGLEEAMKFWQKYTGR